MCAQTERKGKSCMLQRRFKRADHLPFFSPPFYPFFPSPQQGPPPAIGEGFDSEPKEAAASAVGCALVSTW